MTPRPSSTLRELLGDQRDALDERILGPIGGGRERAVEVVQHLEKRHDQRAPAALDVLRDLLAQPHARLVELVGRAAVLAEDLLQLRVLGRQPLLELLDIGGFEPGFLAGFRRRLLTARPPAAVGHLQIRHRGFWICDLQLKLMIHRSIDD